jgi:hypothetical protein
VTLGLVPFDLGNNLNLPFPAREDPIGAILRLCRIWALEKHLGPLLQNRLGFHFTFKSVITV